MSLLLDARQRAMLQEMGITVWAPAPVPPAAATVAPAAPPAKVPAGPEADAPRAPAHVPRASQAPSAPPAPAATPTPAPATPSTPLLHAPQALYPQADPTAVPPELGRAWLIVVESASPQQPLSGEVGQLLDHMLRAMRLHRHPRAFIAPVVRAAAGATQADGSDTALQTLPNILATVRPAMVLALGLGAARAVLASREPLGRLRAAAHTLPDGTPVVISHDPAYLLRAPEAKAAAWADLCRALALVARAP